MDIKTTSDLGVLIVGVGMHGACRASAATLARGVQLVAVTGRDRDASARLAASYDVESVPDLPAGLALPKVDAVVIATPPAEHAVQIRRALEAGKHVLCESPLALDPSEARELAAMARDSRLRLATGFPRRFESPVRDALALVNQGSIGRLETVRVRIGHNASREFLAGWNAGQSRVCGGSLLESGSHACDLIRCLLGEISGAEGTVSDQIGLPTGIESEAHARFQGRDGGSAELWSSWTQPSGSLTIEIHGTRGQLSLGTAPLNLRGTLNDGTRIRRSYRVRRLVRRLHRVWFRCESTLTRELEAFAHPPAEADRSAPLSTATAWDGCRAIEMVQAVYRSARTGQPVALSPLPVRLPTDPRRPRNGVHRS